MSLLRSAFAPRSSVLDLNGTDSFLLTSGYGRKTTAGESVSPATALTLSTWYACIRNISEDVGKLPISIYRKGLRGKDNALDHPLYALLHIAPNPQITSMTLREILTGWALGWGNGYAEIQRDGMGNPIALWPIHPSRVRIRRYDGKMEYIISSSQYQPGAAVTLDPADVFHLRGFGDDPICGLSIARLAAESVGVSLAAQTYGAAFFGNGAAPGVVLIHPGKLTPEAQNNLRESWTKKHGGAENGNRTAVLQEGIKVERISIPPEEAQFIETRTFQLDEIARWFRMPPHKIQQLGRTTFANIEQQSIDYVADTLQPWLVRFEQECERKLMAPAEIGQLEIVIETISILRGDAASRSNYYRTLISTGVLSPNEARAMENLNPIPGDAGDKYYIQGAMTTLDIASTPPDPESPKEDKAEAPSDPQDGSGNQLEQQAQALAPVFADAESRVRRKEEMALANAWKKLGSRTSELSTWAAEFFAGHADYILAAFEPGMAALCASGNRPLAALRDDMAAMANDYARHAMQSALSGQQFTPDQPLAITIPRLAFLEHAHV